METLNAELMKTITELKALPKKDRRAIERQLSGLDKIAVKKAFKIKPPALSESVEESEDIIDADVADEEVIAPNLTMFSPWLKKTLSGLLEEDEQNLKSAGVTQAVSKILPDCIEHANLHLEDFPIKNETHDRATFKSMLLRLRG